jgi:hypothetical protein
MGRGIDLQQKPKQMDDAAGIFVAEPACFAVGAARIERMEVRWPSGQVDQCRDVAADRLIFAPDLETAVKRVVLLALKSGQLAADAIALFERLGLREHLTPQRSNGFRSMVERIRADARAAAAA